MAQSPPADPPEGVASKWDALLATKFHGAGALGPSIFAVTALASWALRPPARRDLAPRPGSPMPARALEPSR
jgi:hypothetical protein